MARKPFGGGFGVVRPKRPSNPFAAKPYKDPPEPKPRNRGHENIICEAIRRQVKLGILYKATDAAERVVLPYVMWATEEGAACLFGVQIQDENGRGESTPKNLDPHRMRAVRIIDERWEIDPTFRRDAYADREIICMVRR